MVSVLLTWNSRKIRLERSMPCLEVNPITRLNELVVLASLTHLSLF